MAMGKERYVNGTYREVLGVIENWYNDLLFITVTECGYLTSYTVIDEEEYEKWAERKYAGDIDDFTDYPRRYDWAASSDYEDISAENAWELIVGEQSPLEYLSYCQPGSTIEDIVEELLTEVASSHQWIGNPDFVPYGRANLSWQLEMAFRDAVHHAKCHFAEWEPWFRRHYGDFEGTALYDLVHGA